jgi:hypothetical protein
VRQVCPPALSRRRHRTHQDGNRRVPGELERAPHRSPAGGDDQGEWPPATRHDLPWVGRTGPRGGAQSGRIRGERLPQGPGPVTAQGACRPTTRPRPSTAPAPEEMHQSLDRLPWVDRGWIPASERPPTSIPQSLRLVPAWPRSEIPSPRSWEYQGAPLSILQPQIGQKTLPPAISHRHRIFLDGPIEKIPALDLGAGRRGFSIMKGSRG